MIVQAFWGVIALLFLVLMLLHLRLSGEKFPRFAFKGGIAKMVGISLGIKEFADDVNDFIVRLDRSQRHMNLAQACGYLVAFLTACFSFFLSLHG